MEELPIYNIVATEEDGINKMSLVNSCAVHVDFIKLSEQKEMTFSIADEDQHIVFGCALRADYPILRIDPNIGKFYIVFDKDVIKDLYEKFMIEGLNNNVNLEHKTDTDGVYMLQSFIKDENNGINPVGFEECADGSWFCSYKILNEDVWADVKAGKFNGFSIEGNFHFKYEEPADEWDNFINEYLN